ncbi:MAG: hypothetical protein ACRDE8_02385 [Ginsengibacter sp.]
MGNKKWVILIILSIGGTAFTNISTISRPDFSGTWLINEGKSEFGEHPLYIASRQIKVKQNDDDIFIERVNMDDSLSYSETISFDGQASKSITTVKRAKVARIKWDDSFEKFTEEADYSIEGDGNKPAFTSAETWSMSGDGNTLTIFTLFEVPAATYSIKAVYDRTN